MFDQESIQNNQKEKADLILFKAFLELHYTDMICRSGTIPVAGFKESDKAPSSWYDKQSSQIGQSYHRM